MEWKASELDNRCSEACVRAGPTALLFSALAISLLQPLARQKSFDALGGYILSRLLLKDALDALETDECWQNLNRRESEVSKWTIARLTDYYCMSEPKEPETNPQIAPPPLNPEVPDAPKEQETNAQIAPPSAARIGAPLDSAVTIANQLTALGSGDLLTYARRATNQYDFKIYRWTVLRHRLLRQNGWVPGPASNRGKSSGDSTPSYSREELLQHLTLENVRVLASEELPNISEIATPLRGEEKPSPLSPTALPLTIIPASIFVNLVILFSLAYFWFFQHEARRSDTFLAPGTLFGVLNRTKISRRFAFPLLMITPAISVISLTWFVSDLLLYTPSPKPSSNFIVAGLNIVISLLVLWFTGLIAREGGFSLKGLLQGLGRVGSRPSAG
jgi:hypothetical protein